MDKNKEEKIKHVMHELIENGNLEIIDDFFTENYIAHAGEKEYSGHSFLKRFSKKLRKAIPDIHAVELKFLAHDNDTVVWQRILEGTHKVDMQGIPASGKKF